MAPFAAIFSPGPTELILILVLVMIFFGVGKLPQVGSALGKSIKAFKQGQRDDALDVTASAEQLEAQSVEDEVKSSS